VGFAVDVGPSGRVMGCAITRSSGSAALDSATCRLIQSRARFTPALDAGGAPVSDKVAGRISWVLPPAPAS
jgi:protein TonB